MDPLVPNQVRYQTAPHSELLELVGMAMIHRPLPHCQVPRNDSALTYLSYPQIRCHAAGPTITKVVEKNKLKSPTDHVG